MAPEALILDFGEVLTRSQPPAIVDRMVSASGLGRDQFLARYWAHRAAYDGGLTARDYWHRVLDGAGSLAEATLHELIDQDVRSWMDYRTEVWDVLAAFRARGHRTAMLSNGVPEIIARVREDRPLDRWFDVVIVSCEVGVSKPDPAIYRICLERLGVAPAGALFVDDRIENLESAWRAGLQTLHFTGDASVDDLRRALDL